MKIVYLFPDTNLFIQCIALEEIDWSEWGVFDELHLIVSRPVQKEIDHQKNRGNNRIGRRARQTWSLFRDVLRGHGEYKLVRNQGPCVKLFIKPEYKPSNVLSKVLSYDERDDQLVGIVHAFADQNRNSDVRLLTHDAGPMAAAQLVDVEVVPIPEKWLRPAEDSTEEKKIRALEDENRRLKKAEPHFSISCVNDQNKEVDELEYEYHYYEPLAGQELAALVERIRARYPPATDFGPRETSERDSLGPAHRLLGGREVFTPATEKDIEAYHDKVYPTWLQKCEATLRQMHTALQRQSGRPGFCFLARNDGTRPGKDVLVLIEAKGSCKIMPPAGRSHDDEDEGELKQAIHESIKLPNPPEPPRGRWDLAVDHTLPGGLFSTFHDIQRHLQDIQRSEMLSNYGPSPSLFGLREVESRRDPNAFYYKHSHPTSPQGAFALECEQWRHGMDDEHFEGELCFDATADEISGAVECSIHAENLSDAAIMRIPVRVRIVREDTYARAAELVDQLLGRI